MRTHARIPRRYPSHVTAPPPTGIAAQSLIVSGRTSKLDEFLAVLSPTEVTP